MILNFQRIVPLAGTLMILSIIPLIMHDLFILRLLVLSFIFVNLAESWNLIGGYAGQISLGHAAFFGLGAYTYALLNLWVELPTNLAIPLGGGVAAFVAGILAVPSFRWRGDVFAFGTLAFAETLRIVFSDWKAVGGSVGLTIQRSNLDALSAYYVSLLWTVISLLSFVLLVGSGFGKALPAIRHDELLATSVGIPVLKYKSAVFILSSFMAGTSGSVYALNMLFVNPTLFAVNWTAVPVLIAIVGGTATILGPILMALVYVFLLLSVFSSFPTLNQVVYGLLLIAISLVLPRGLTNLLKRTGKSVRLAQPHFPR